jgi:alanine dehydrogenase
LLPRSLVRQMRGGSVIVDIAIEEGGVAETSRATTHVEPSYVEEGVIHYCVGNMPAARPREAAAAISAAALPYVIDMAEAGVAAALRVNPELREGVLLWQGRANHSGIAAEAGLPYTPLTDADLVE